VRFLIDEPLSPAVAVSLVEAGHDALHLSDIGLLGATDTDVMAAAAGNGRVLVSADTDFGELLALGRRPGPSVIIFRRAPRQPEAQALMLLENLDSIESPLAAGAVVVLTWDSVRFRHLPIDRKD
jgi:predicted nuclease of predicted toxin-antitoxin system